MQCSISFNIVMYKKYKYSVRSSLQVSGRMLVHTVDITKPEQVSSAVSHVEDLLRENTNHGMSLISAFYYLL